MTTRLYADDELAELRSMPKRVTNPNARWTEKPTHAPVHRQRNFKVRTDSETGPRFEIYARQNLLDEVDFSCGIAYLPLDGSRLTLARYNGSSHVHGDIEYQTHIHGATAAAIAAGRKPEREAHQTERYETLDGALACLVDDFNVSGVQTRPDRPRLF